MAYPFTLPELKYAYDAIGAIDSTTMEIHHSKHHAAYINNLNAALEKHVDYHSWSIEDLLQKADELPADIKMAVINNGGGHLNHSIYWQTISPGGKELSADSELAKAITAKFGSFEQFKEQFSQKAMTVFGSGWAWLIVDENGELALKRTSFQNNPIVNPKVKVLLGIDVWEHAYYLKHQNKRADYVADWFSVVEWQQVEARYNG